MIFILCEGKVQARRAMSTRGHMLASVPPNAVVYVSSRRDVEGLKVGPGDRLIIIGNGTAVKQCFEALWRSGKATNVDVTELFTARIWP